MRRKEGKTNRELMEISSSSSPKNMPPMIPNDVIFEILSWAPANSLMRFRWACKYWFDSIRDPKFVKMHLLHQYSTTTDDDDDQFINNTSLLMTTHHSRDFYSMECRDVFNQSSSLSSLKKIKMDFYNVFPKSKHLKHQELVFWGSCLGLIYFVYHCIRSGGRANRHFVWNPFTRELKELPQPKVNNRYPDYVYGTSFIVHGFGYDHTINDYKVIRVEYFTYYDGEPKYDDYNSRETNVYTLGSNSWSTKVETIPLIIDYCKNTYRSSGMFINGAFHWLMRSSKLHGNLRLAKIISFDIAKEEHGEIQLPAYLAKLCWLTWDLRVLNGCLCLFNNNAYDNIWDVWMMKDYCAKDSWTKLFTIDMKQLLNDIFEPATFWCKHNLMLLKYRKDGRILMVFNEKYIIVYDPTKEKRSKLIRYGVHKIEDDDRFEDVIVEETYIGTLVSLNSGKYLTVAGSKIATFQKHEREEEDNQKNRTRGNEDQEQQLCINTREEEDQKNKKKRRSRTTTLHKYVRKEEDQRKKKKKRRIYLTDL